MRQGIEVYRSDEEFSARGDGPLGQTEKHDFPAGSYLFPAAQAQGRLVHALLDLDPRIDETTLLKEREQLERKGLSRLYDVTAWNFVHASGLDAWWVKGPATKSTQLTKLEPVKSGLVGAAPEHTVAWVVDGSADASVVFAAAAMEAGIATHLADKAFRFGKRSFPRGSILVRRHENDKGVGKLVEAAAKAAGVQAHALGTLRSPDDGPDLGGQHFDLLSRPRVALLSNSPVSASDYGHVWRELDQCLHIPFSILDAQALGQYDLRRYNVLIVPPAWGDVSGLLGSDINNVDDPNAFAEMAIEDRPPIDWMSSLDLFDAEGRTALTGDESVGVLLEDEEAVVLDPVEILEELVHDEIPRSPATFATHDRIA